MRIINDRFTLIVLYTKARKNGICRIFKNVNFIIILAIEHYSYRGWNIELAKSRPIYI